ncbi:MAG TPA: heavy-metal-associated domain-containing protein [Microvirga sp.]|jgi:copper chaperone|nr:heavy-metal-associated domain-containing protein [Microvirga sp.]
MHVFQIPTMTCGGCVKAVTRTLQGVDPQATVEAELARHEVRVRSSASEAALKSALEKAGYPAIPVVPALG